MLMIPPALATKSGRPQDAARPAAARRRCRRRAGCSPRRRSTGACSARDGVVVEHAAQRARGEHVDRRGQRLGRASTQRAPSAPRVARLAGSMSATSSRAPRRASRRARRSADVPEPDDRDAAALAATPMPKARSHVASTAASTPSAVYGLGSPEPPARRGRPVTWRRARGDDRHVARRGADVLGGDVAAAERVDRVAEVQQHVAPAPAPSAARVRRRGRSRPCRRRAAGRRPPTCRSSRARGAGRRAAAARVSS